VVVTYGDSYIGWNYDVARELSTIRPALFKALRFNPQLLDMSARILGSPELNGGNFIGVHLRGENDWPAPFGSVDDQMRLYTEQIEKIQLTVNGGVKTVYVSVSTCISSNSLPVLEAPFYVLEERPDVLSSVEIQQPSKCSAKSSNHWATLLSINPSSLTISLKPSLS
jgi:hypothetical protein